MHTHVRALFLVLIPLIFSAGCSKEKAAGSPDWPWGNRETTNLEGCKNTCTTSEMYQSVIAATSYCRQVSNFYEGTGNINSRTKLGVKVLGVIAGSIFGVTAGGTAAKAWSSLSGATNGIQTDLGDEALVRSNRSRVIGGLLEKFHTEIRDALATSTISDAEKAKVVLASIAVSGRCATYSQELPIDESAKLEEEVAAINKLVGDQLKTPEQLAADKIAAEKIAEKSAAVDKAYSDMKIQEAKDAASNVGGRPSK